MIAKLSTVAIDQAFTICCPPKECKVHLLCKATHWGLNKSLVFAYLPGSAKTRKHLIGHK